MNLIIAIAIGYLLGSIPFGLVFAKLFGYGDLRKVGSGNIGTTNAMRAGGIKLALLVLIFDAAKAFAAAYFFGIWAGLAAVVGHNYPIWLKFKGGKGLAASAGFALAVAPIIVAICFPIWLIVALTFGYSSLGALVVLAVAPILGFVISTEIGLAFLGLAILGYWRHRENIKRLLSGTESKIKWKK